MRYLPLALFLAACAGVSDPVWIKPGTPALKAEQEYLACAARAQTDFPVASRIRSSSRITVGTSICRGWFCYGGYSAPDVHEDDPNEELRARAFDVCMTTKGYRAVDLPACSTQDAAILQSQPYDLRGLCEADGRIAAD
ncbi:hypothetical protein [uncultured Jannaschia sp.]|uniref:hypothetical protein n=1 Tax=uncultured Jannaschia sp. TaxID=293347 RepID=UPI00261387AD|nr:hypothetical protein [uncultured Jannaschia sp.]